jgi:SAM-dependent methyltransferase
MSKKKKKVDSKEIGLEIGLKVYKFFFDTEYLHYGYWINGLKVDATNLKQAQENYANFLLSNIPEGVKSILDVGCGSGKFALDLYKSGYQVDCVSPSERLTAYARNILPNEVELFHGKYEEVKIEKKFDLILFSESFQYIDMHQSLGKSLEYLNDKGYLLLSDFFQTEEPGKSPLGGGHKLTEFREIYPQYPYTLVKDTDITKDIAPTMNLVNELTMEVVKPLAEMIGEILESKLKFLYRILKWKFRKKLDKLNNKHFQGQRNAENFIRYKSYRMMLFQRN